MLVNVAGVGGVQAEYADIVMNRYADREDVRPVIFQHWFHRIRYQCRVCHTELGFEMRAGSTDVTIQVDAFKANVRDFKPEESFLIEGVSTVLATGKKKAKKTPAATAVTWASFSHAEYMIHWSVVPCWQLLLGRLGESMVPVVRHGPLESNVDAKFSE